MSQKLAWILGPSAAWTLWIFLITVQYLIVQAIIYRKLLMYLSFIVLWCWRMVLKRPGLGGTFWVFMKFRHHIIFSYLFSNNYLNRLDATPILGLTQKPKLGLRQITNHLTLLFFRTKIPSTRIFYFSFPFLLLVAGHWTRGRAAQALQRAQLQDLWYW